MALIKQWFKAADDNNIAFIVRNIEQLKLSRDELGNTALIRASLAGNIDIIRLLIPHELKLMNHNGRTALMQSVFQKNADVTDLLLEEALMTDNESRTALMLAISQNNCEAAHLLLKEQKCQDSKGRSALMYAAGLPNSLKIAQLLRSEFQLTDENGNSALIYATYKSNQPLVEYLVAFEAGIKNNSNETALQIAIEKQDNALVQILRQYEDGIAGLTVDLQRQTQMIQNVASEIGEIAGTQNSQTINLQQIQQPQAVQKAQQFPEEKLSAAHQKSSFQQLESIQNQVEILNSSIQELFSAQKNQSQVFTGLQKQQQDSITVVKEGQAELQLRFQELLNQIFDLNTNQKLGQHSIRQLQNQLKTVNSVLTDRLGEQNNSILQQMGDKFDKIGQLEMKLEAVCSVIDQQNQQVFSYKKLICDQNLVIEEQNKQLKIAKNQIALLMESVETINQERQEQKENGIIPLQMTQDGPMKPQNVDQYQLEVLSDLIRQHSSDGYFGRMQENFQVLNQNIADLGQQMTILQGYNYDARLAGLEKMIQQLAKEVYSVE